MTNKTPSKQAIIDAINKKVNNVKKNDKPTHNTTVVKQERRNQTLQINKSNNESKLNTYIDNRCRYWIENRISQLLMSNNFTTREGYTFSIDNDRTRAGMCFRFIKNGTTIAKIDSDGCLYCNNVFANGTNLSYISRFVNDMNSGLAIYVKDSDLKNGEYVLDINKITAKSGYFKKYIDINKSKISSVTVEGEDEEDIEELTITSDDVVFTGNVNINGSTNVDTDLTVHGDTTIEGSLSATDTNINGDLTLVGDSSFTGSFTITGNPIIHGDTTLDGTLVSNNTITTTMGINAASANITNTINADIYYGNVSNITTLNASTLNATDIYVNSVNPKNPATSVLYTGEATFNNTRFKHIKSDLNDGAIMYEYVGKTTNTDESALLEYFHSGNIGDRYIRLSLTGRDGIKAQNTSITSELQHYFNNGIDVTGVVSYFRLSNALYLYTSSVKQQAIALTSGNSCFSQVGKNTDNYNSYQVRYYYHNTDSNRFASIGLIGAEAIKMFKDKIELLLDTNINGDVAITGSVNIDTDLNVGADVSITGDLNVSGTTIYHDTITASSANITGDANVSGDTTLNTLTVASGTFQTLTVSNLTQSDIFSVFSSSVNGCGMYIGKERDNDKCGVIHYDTTNNILQLGIYGTAPDILKISNNNVSVNGSNVVVWNDVWSTATTGDPKNHIPYIRNDGVMEIGKYLDFHSVGSTSDYNMRIYWDGTYMNVNKPIYCYETSSNTVGQFLTNYASTYFNIGRNASNGYLQIRCYYSSTLADRFITMGLQGYNCLVFYYNKAHFGYPVDIDSGLTVNSGGANITGTLTSSDKLTVSSNGADITGLLVVSADSNNYIAKMFNNQTNSYVIYGRSDNDNGFLNYTYSTSPIVELGITKTGNGSSAYITFVDNSGTPFIRLNKNVESLTSNGGISGTTGNFSSTLTVSGSSILQAITATSGTFSADISAINGTFTGNLNVLDSSLSTGNWKQIYLGQSASSNNCGRIDYYYHSTAADRYMRLSMYGYNGVNIYNGKVLINTLPLHIMNGILSSGSSMTSYIGRSLSNGFCAYHNFYYNSTVTLRCLKLGIYGYSGVDIFTDRIDLTLPVICDSTLSGTSATFSGNVSITGNLSVSGTTTYYDTITATTANISGDVNVGGDTTLKSLYVYNENADSDNSDYAILAVGEDSTYNVKLEYQRNTHYLAGSTCRITVHGTEHITIYPGYSLQINNFSNGVWIANQLTCNNTISSHGLSVSYGDNMTEGQELNIPFGDMTGLYNYGHDYGNLIYGFSQTLANSYVKLGIKGYENLMLKTTSINTSSTINQMKSDMTNNETITYYIGRDTSTNGNCGILQYVYNSSSTSKYLKLQLNGYDGIEVQPFNINVKQLLQLSQQFNQLRSDASSMNYYIGRDTSAANCGRIYYSYSSSLSNRYLSIGLVSYEALRLAYDKITMMKPITSSYSITSTDTVTANKLEVSSSATTSIGDNLTSSILKLVYPVGAVYISMDPSGILPTAIASIGTWESIVDRFLYCSGTAAGTTGGSTTHRHNLSGNGYALLATHGAGNICVRERTTPSWTPTLKMTTGSYTTAPSYDQYGQELGGTTDYSSATSDYPPFMTCYAWRRTA